MTTTQLNWDDARKAVRKRQTSLIIDGALEEKPYKVAFISNFNTACWSHDPKGDGCHIIKIGQGLDQNLDDDKKDRLPEYVLSYFDHEVAHSLWTQKDLNSIAEQAKRSKVSFGLVNLIEDARIEHKWRSSEFGKKFNWYEFEKSTLEEKEETREFLETKPQRAIRTMFTLINTENDLEKTHDIIGDEELVDDVKPFYDQAIEAKGTAEAVWVAADFAHRFNIKEEEEIQERPKPTLTDLATTLSAKEFGEHKQLEEIADKQLKTPTINFDEKKLNSTKSKYANGKIINDDTAPSSTVINPATVKTMVSLLSSSFKVGERNTTALAGKKISSRHAARKSPRIFRRIEKDSPRHTQITIIVDCSGSMYPTAHENSHLLLALGEIAKQHIIKGSIILSGVESRKAIHQEFNLNEIDEDLVRKIPFHYTGEGLQSAIIQNENVITKRDLCLVITDGAITDDPIDKKRLHSKGVYTVGSYIGNPKNSAHLQKWFDAAVSRRSGTSLAAALGKVIRNNSKTYDLNQEVPAPETESISYGPKVSK